MNVDIKSTVDNKLLDRKEIEAEVSFDGATPSRNDFKQAICGKVGANPDLVVLRDIQTTYGKHTAKVIAHSYVNKESLMSIEPEHIKKRYKMEEAKKEEPSKEAAAEAKEE